MEMGWWGGGVVGDVLVSSCWEFIERNPDFVEEFRSDCGWL